MYIRTLLWMGKRYEMRLDSQLNPHSSEMQPQQKRLLHLSAFFFFFFKSLKKKKNNNNNKKA